MIVLQKLCKKRELLLLMKFNEYYKEYLKLHQNKVNRRLHVAGNLATLLFIFLCVTCENYIFLFLSPFIVYPFAWSGHYFFEKNKPAAFSAPIYAKLSDWVMIKDIFTGKIPW